MSCSKSSVKATPRNRLKHQPQDRNRVDQCCLSKEIGLSGLSLFQDVFPLPVRRRVLIRRIRHDLLDLRVYVPTHVHEREQLLHERLVAAAPLRGGSTTNRRTWCAEDVRSVASAEGDPMHESVEFRVVRDGADRVGGMFNAGGLGEVRSEGDREKPGAGIRWVGGGRHGARRIRVHGRGREDDVADVRGEEMGTELLFWKKAPALVIEEQVTDAFQPLCDLGLKLEGVIVFEARWL